MEQITENHPLSGSQDILADNIQKLKEIFPEVFSEGRVDFEKLQLLLGDLISPKDDLYGLNWWGKNEAIKESMKRSLGTLRPDKESSKNWDTTENLYIEGDNLEVLKLLQKSYNGKIKMIYIDPPYNTGNDFVYKDNYKDNLKSYLEQTGQVDSDGLKQSTNTKEDGRYHSNWLNMMYPRLKLARNLLTEDGVIFISIDEHEVDNLKKISDEVFAEQNFVSQLTIIVKTEGRRYGHFAKTHEYLLVYSKNIESLNLNELEVIDKEFKYNDEIGGFDLKELRNQNTRAFNSLNRRNLRYPFYVDENSEDENGLMNLSVNKIDGYSEVFAISVDGLESVWRWGKSTSEKNEKDSLIAKRGNDGIIRIFQKYRSKTQSPKTVWFDKEIISIKGTKEIQDLFEGKTVFDFPKPVEFIRRLIEIGTNEDDLILDFFSGSSTTSHAVMLQNSIDFKKRNYLSIQLPEKIIDGKDALELGFLTISSIARDRIRRAGEKIMMLKREELVELKTKTSLIQTEEEKAKIQELEEIISKLDVGFKVFKLDSSNIEAWNTEMPETVQGIQTRLEESRNHLQKGRTEEDLLFELLLKQGLMLTSPIQVREIAGAKVYNISHGDLFICMNSPISMAVIEGIGTWGQECIEEAIVDLKPVLVLKDEAFGKDDAFKTNAELRLLNEFGFAKVNTL